MLIQSYSGRKGLASERLSFLIVPYTQKGFGSYEPCPEDAAENQHWRNSVTGCGGGQCGLQNQTSELQLLPCPESFRDLWDKYVNTCLLQTPLIYQQKQQDYKVVKL